jgi:hypothetical protein
MQKEEIPFEDASTAIVGPAKDQANANVRGVARG